ncbi:diacylglycerol kinase family protein [Pseudocolwellia sp. AS88]|uniref:diacylglycerol kinase family protein n=1 Tax=Pseudocolwellia sp. AS88 TaxID=3063958 RepID=UPI0026F0C984|nr:diacylglycerol kinase family protein [Pseudocolwellia sp. AS88]MDO7085198.1 diacylglycerol kinase family protein [Pseudocolwellia sp. AS88]
MFILKYYITGALIAFVLAFAIAPWYFSIILIWLSLSLFSVSAAYVFDAPSIFRKQDDGSIPAYISWLFFPFFLGVQMYNSWTRKTDKVPAIQEITPKLYLACRLFPSDIEFLKNNGIDAILDATSEFSGLNWSANDQKFAYRNIPILDHSSPRTNDLQEAINWIDHQIKSNKGVVVHCALGRGRSVLIVAAYLLAKGKCNNVDDALAYINRIRGTANLNSHQYKKISQMFESSNFKPAPSILLIVNPVSGAGSWAEHQNAIKQRLAVKYQITVIETHKNKSAKEIARANKNKNFQLIVACGGDGTVNEVASELVNNNQELAIIPLGTTNALAHVLFGIKAKVDPIGVACEIILNGVSTPIDTAICNEDISLLVTGLGFEQKMIENAGRKEKDDKGQLAYINSLTHAINKNEVYDLKIWIDNKPPIKKKISSLIIANAAPFTTILAQGHQQPNISDGKLDMTILDTSEHQLLPIIGLGTNVLKPTWMEAPKINGLEHLLVSQIKIISDFIMDYVIDGETRQSKEINIKVNPASLKVLVEQ